jgi:hypothetical protein
VEESRDPKDYAENGCPSAREQRQLARRLDFALDRAFPVSSTPLARAELRAGARWASFWRVSEIIFRVNGRSQPVTVDDALDIRGRLVERTLAADELRSAISGAIRRAESGERPAVDVTEEMRGELFKVLVAIKGDRGLTAALSELEVTLLR